MRICVIVAACSVTAALISIPSIAQTVSDTAASQPAAATTKAALRSQNLQLSKAVRHALYSTKGLDATRISVFARGGKVSLVGTVVDEAQIQVAGDAAKRVPKVVAVDNRLIVAEDGGQ
ncbi:BON domain-containing protein [Paraburkholderia sp. BL23I1N1]|uniref:BON domain-containing protein n=1 Tax=Paraburkholderia sp. BL23I1N1 TaxID=1938802 RepID=UPI000E773574|nr:BON domain-containing protein [Paraburkholderia sp. BL23I1N1]RKE39230.1 BON domain-containing protein [Paraburkholderia sp. BL23I1N1]